MKHTLYHHIQERKSAGKKSFAVLIDPDKVNVATTEQLVSLALDAGIDYFFVGGSLVLLISACVFAPVYLIAANLWGLIEENEKESVKKIVRRVMPKRFGEPAVQAR